MCVGSPVHIRPPHVRVGSDLSVIDRRINVDYYTLGGGKFGRRQNSGDRNRGGGKVVGRIFGSNVIRNCDIFPYAAWYYYFRLLADASSTVFRLTRTRSTSQRSRVTVRGGSTDLDGKLRAADRFTDWFRREFSPPGATVARATRRTGKKTRKSPTGRRKSARAYHANALNRSRRCGNCAGDGGLENTRPD